MPERDYSISLILKATNRFSAPLKLLASDLNKVKDAARGMKQHFAEVLSFSRGIQKVGKYLSVAVTAPVAALGAFSVKSALSFNELMSQIEAGGKTSAARINEIKKEILSLGSEFGKMPEEVAKGTVSLVRAFGDTPDLLERVRIATMGAKAAFGEVDSAAELSSAVLHTYGDTSIALMKKIMNAAAIARHEGFIGLKDLTKIMNRALPPAAKMGAQVEEVFSLMVLLSKVSPEAASRTGFQLGTLFESIMRKIPQAGEMIKRIGLIPFLSQLAEALGDNDKAIAEFTGGNRALAGSLVVLREIDKDVISIHEKLTDKVDRLLFYINLQKTGVNRAGFAWDQFKAVMQDVRVEIGDILLPTFMRIIIAVGNFADKLLGTTTTTKKLIVAFAAMSAATGPVIYGFGKILELGVKLAIMFGVLKYYGITLFGAKGIFVLAAKSVGIFLLPFLKIVGILALVTGAIYLLVKALDTLDKRAMKMSKEKLYKKGRERVLGRQLPGMVYPTEKEWDEIDRRYSRQYRLGTREERAEAFSEWKKGFMRLLKLEMIPPYPKSEITIKIKNETDKEVTVDKMATDFDSPIMRVFTEGYLGYGEAY